MGLLVMQLGKWGAGPAEKNENRLIFRKSSLQVREI
jgi:hypothetical protein